MNEEKIIARWLHLSDMHVMNEADTNLILKAYERLAKEFSPDFIIITGDFRHKKLSCNFKRTLCFLEEIIKIFHVEKENIFIVPGNHDVNDYPERNIAIAEIVQKIDDNYNIYIQHINKRTTLYNGFIEYKKFVKTFYKNSTVNDERIKKIGKPFNIVWNNKLNLLHINTALISNGEKHQEIIDINAITQLQVNKALPTIMLGHHGLESLYLSHQDRIKIWIHDNFVSAYLHGDIHKYEHKPIHPFPLSNNAIPQIACGKSVPQSDDHYSDIGIVAYTWREDNNTYVDAYNWNAGEFRINSVYITKMRDAYSFPMIYPSINPTEETHLPISQCTDRIALRINNDENRALITQAILNQVAGKNDDQKKFIKDLDSICQKILSSSHHYPLIIRGEPGTGKSTLLSNIYLKLSKNKSIYTALIDLHYFDNISAEKSRIFSEMIANVNQLIDSNKKVYIFIDGIDLYKRMNKNLNNLLNKEIQNWINQKNAHIIFSTGALLDSQFPPFTHSCNKMPQDIETTLILHPLNVESASFHALVEQTLNAFNILNQSEYTTRKERNKIISQFVNYCKKICGNESDFRSLIFVIEQFEESHEVIFQKNGGTIFLNEFKKRLGLQKLNSTAKNIADFMLNNRSSFKNIYVYKSPAIRDFFFALHYINMVKKEDIDNKKLFDCIFTPNINRFCIDLISKSEKEELNIVNNFINIFNKLKVRGKNQIAYLLGRVKSNSAKGIAGTFLEEQYRVLSTKYEQIKLDCAQIMLLRSIGISLINIEKNTYADDFYTKLIFCENMRIINRNFHIIYYSTNAYKVSSTLEIENSNISSSENIKKLYSKLYHSLNKLNINKINYVSLITLVDLVIYKHYRNPPNLSTSDLPKGFINLLSGLLDKNAISNTIVKDYIIQVKEIIIKPNIYTDIFSRIYNLKKFRRAGWYKPRREIDKKEQPESIAEHIWATCMIAQLFLTDKINDCQFMSNNEKNKYAKEYSKHKIISLLLVHDFPEAYTSDIPDDPEKKEKETRAMKCLPALDAFPYFYMFRNIKNTWNEYEEKSTFNSKIAFDIDKLEPLIQLYIYRDLLNPKLKCEERDNWMEQTAKILVTDFGRNMYTFLKDYLLSDSYFFNSDC